MDYNIYRVVTVLRMTSHPSTTLLTLEQRRPTLDPINYIHSPFSH